MAAKETYDAGSIDVLEGLEAVRERPGMYIGSTGEAGLHHLLWEILDNAIDEAMNGHADVISVEVDPKSRTATVIDNGRGIPFDQHPKLKKPAAEVIFTTLHAGGKFGGGAYKTAGGLHGVGSSVVNALSSEMHIEIYRDGKRYTQTFKRGKALKPKTVKGRKNAHGTRVDFVPDKKIFGSLTFDTDLVIRRVKTKAYLTPGVRFTVNGEEFKFDGGLIDLLGDRLESLGLTPVTDFPLSIREEGLHVAITWTDDSRPLDDLVASYANGIPTRDGGTHLSGLKAGVSEAVREWMQDVGEWPKKPQVQVQDIREGVCGAIHVLVENPQFQGQTKDRLNNQEVQGSVRSAVRVAVKDWLLKNGQQAQALAHRIIEAAKARTAARAARSQVKRKSITKKLTLPGKLADCSSSDVGETELFIVEGDSAGGSAKQGRDRRTQAVLPLRGKIINAVRESAKKVRANSQIQDLVEAIGTGMGPSFDLSGLRYGKVILLMDADVDGHHISTLMLGFMYTYMRPLIDAGHVYLAKPPLYYIKAGAKTMWAADDAEKKKILKKLSKSQAANAEIGYFKGLGEMPPKVLFDTTMNPQQRRLLRVDVPDGQEVTTAIVINDLLGNDTEKRLPYMEETALRPEDLSV